MSYFVGNVLLVYFLLIGVALTLFVCGVAFLVWLIKAGQLEDLDTPALRMLHDDDQVERPHAD